MDTPQALFKLGCNFDIKLIEEVLRLNQRYNKAKVTTLYGAIRSHAWLSARPQYRLPDLTSKELIAYITRLRKAGLSFNYSLNSIYCGTNRELESKAQQICELVRFLVDIGVSAITIASPLMAEIVRSASTSVNLEVSTITHIDTVSQIKVWNSLYKISGVCGNLLKNRSFRFLECASRYCMTQNIAYEVMVNEFCSASDANGESTTHCIFRDSCYLSHATNETVKDAHTFRQYPMSRCIALRNSAAAWLKSRFIRPEDIRLYLALGIRNFKITGRTGSTAYIIKVAQAYMRQRWDGNLLELWKNLETIDNCADDYDYKPSLYIDNRSLNDFLTWWIMDSSHNCELEVCGESCRYCDEYAARALQM